MSFGFQSWNSLEWNLGLFSVVEFTPVNRNTSANCPGITMWHQHTKWISICKAIVYMCNEVSELWEMNAFHCESEPPPSFFLYFHHPIYQKYVCCYCVHTISVYMTYNLHRKAKMTTLILTVDHEAILQVVANYLYSDFHCLYFLFVCTSLQCVCFCCLPCSVWRSLLENWILFGKWMTESAS